MIFRKLVGWVAALAAIAAAAITCTVSIGFAIYAGLRDMVGSAWAAAGEAGILAVLAVALAFAVTLEVKPKPVKEEDTSLTAKLIELARERPLVAAGAVAAAAAVVIKNPRILAAAASAFFAAKPPPRK